MNENILIKVLLDHERKPFIPYVPATAVFLKDEHGDATSIQGYLLRALQDRLTPDNLGDYFKTINNQSIVGSGNIPVSEYTAGDGIDITDNVITNTRNSAEWGNVSGTIDSQLDLMTLLNAKASTDYVNSSIATNTAYFRGTSATGLTEQQFLAWADTLTKTNNDYCFWNTVDSAGNTQFKRYKYDGTNWIYEYTLNNSSYTSNQWAAINSGITAAKVTTYDEYATSKQNTLTAGTGIDITSNTIKVNLVNNLTSTSTSSALTAKQGKLLNDAVSAKQDTLVSGTNIKTINNNSILGSGNISVTNVYSGTSEPAASLGSDGDIYILLDA